MKSKLYTEDLRERVDGHRAERFLEELLEAGETDFLNGAMRADLHSFLPGNVLEYGDKMSMAHGLELRLPFLDPELVKLMACLPAELKIRHQTKVLLRKIMAGKLPSSILQRRKAGFNPPMSTLIERELREKTDEYLGSRGFPDRRDRQNEEFASRWQTGLLPASVGPAGAGGVAPSVHRLSAAGAPGSDTQRLFGGIMRS